MTTSNGIATTDLGQRGRSDMQALGAIQVAAFNALRGAARANFYASDEGRALGQAHRLEDDDAKAVRKRVKQATELANRDPTFRMERFLQRYVAEENWRRAIVSVEAKRATFSAFVEPPEAESAPGATSASLDSIPSCPSPASSTPWNSTCSPAGGKAMTCTARRCRTRSIPTCFRGAALLRCRRRRARRTGDRA